MGDYQSAPDLGAIMADLTKRVTDLERVILRRGIPDWHNVGTVGEVAFASGWTNLGTGWNPVGFSKDGDGFVHLRGMASGPSAGGPTVFTLPVGFRPLNTESHVAKGGHLTAGVVICMLHVQPGGDVQVASGQTNQWNDFLLDNHSFFAG